MKIIQLLKGKFLQKQFRKELILCFSISLLWNPDPPFIRLKNSDFTLESKLAEINETSK